MTDDNKEFYVATVIDGRDTIYSSESFKLSEIDLINLIKVCVVERRNLRIGYKLLEVYKDSTKDREKITEKRLELIGIKNNGTKPTTTASAKHR